MTTRNPPTADAVEKNPSPPGQTDEDVQRDRQASNGSCPRDVVGHSSLSRLERLPTELLSHILSYDYLTWKDLDACSQTCDRLRAITRPERGLNQHFCAEVHRVEIYSRQLYTDGDQNYIDELEPEFWTFGGVDWRDQLNSSNLDQLATQRVEELVANYGFDPGDDSIPTILRAYPNTRSVLLADVEHFTRPDELLEAVPDLRELELVEDEYEVSDEEIWIETLAEAGVRYIA
ncbi:hypothetical protein JCM10020v2_001236 [Rhodotorula toruloides]